MTVDYTEIDKQQALKHARDMIAQRGGVDCDIKFDDELGFVRFDFDGSEEYSWVYPDGTRDVQHPDTEDGGLFEAMSNTPGDLQVPQVRPPHVRAVQRRLHVRR